MSFDYDVVVIGSGFGGSVTALRLTEKGYRVGVLEAGQRFEPTTLPKTSWDVRRFLWAPKLGCYGIQRIHVLPNVVVLAGAGVGGGSLVYANTLYEPLPAFYDDPQWRHITDWRRELAPFYDQAKRMLGVVENPVVTAADEIMREIAEEMGAGESFHPTRVGVFFGERGVAPGTEVEDPFFGGAGPRRRTCTTCGACMIGCKENAKNSLDRNYLYLAERAGAQIHPMTTVTAVRPLAGGGYLVEAVRTGRSAWWKKNRLTFRAEHVVFAAGTYNTQLLLHRMRDTRMLPHLSSRLGVLTRTNSEAILGATAKSADVDHSRGIAITSSFHPDGHTHIEPNHFGKGNDAMGLLATALADGGKPYPRFFTWLKEVAKRPLYFLGFGHVRRWAERTIVLLVMQTLDNSITVSGKRTLGGRFKLTSTQGHGQPNPTWIPVAHDTVRRFAGKIDGIAGGSWGDIFNTPMTAHFLGGCAIGDSAQTGVVDPYHRIYGHPGLHVVDGAAISANLGVNPSLTITAQAERAMSMWPNRGDADPRPALGTTYQPIAPIAPTHPTVPAHAPGALRL
ncbi:GMC family oxidoreductase [Pendulispora rubella]|uniref:Cholesterol oxidase n=1 Tax=Pendulispora rubella TaxID=2741070 RepID=A0ABZ2KTL5_9BACT